MSDQKDFYTLRHFALLGENINLEILTLEQPQISPNEEKIISRNVKLCHPTPEQREEFRKNIEEDRKMLAMTWKERAPIYAEGMRGQEVLIYQEFAYDESCAHWLGRIELGRGYSPWALCSVNISNKKVGETVYIEKVLDDC